MTKLNIIENLIQEDIVNHQTSSEGEGYGWHNRTNPSQMSLIDILKVDRSDQDKAKKVLPYEVQTTFEKVLGIVDNVDELKSDFIRAYNNPVIADDSDKRQSIKDIVGDFNNINKQYIKIIKKLEELSI